MPYLNKVIIIGHAGRDAELKFTPSGVAVCKFSVATSETRKGEKVTEWHNVTAFGKQAEWAGESLKKGGVVYVEGRIQTEKWVDKAGEKHERVGIVANDVKVFAKKPKEETHGETHESQGRMDETEMPF
jgi:single-strand DNA-binding protein